MKILFIYNPKSGKDRVTTLDKIKDYISNSEDTCFLFQTRASYGPVEYAEDKGLDYDVIVSCGGDGTVSLTIEGMMLVESSASLVILPLGSTNEYAQALGINGSVDDCLARITDASIESIDVGRINDHYFSYVACFGNFTSITYETPQKVKNKIGHAAYWLHGFFKLRVMRNYYFKVNVNGNVYDDNFLLGMFSNSDRFGRIFRYDPSTIDLSDGKIEMLLVRRPHSLRGYLVLLRKLLTHDYSGDYFILETASKVELVSEKKHSWNLDGDLGGKYRTVLIDVLKKRIKIHI